MPPIVMLLLGKLLDYLADHSDEIIEAIREQFFSARHDPKVMAAVDNLSNNPSKESLEEVHEAMKEYGEDTDKLAKIIINKANV